MKPLILPASVRDQARAFFEERGAFGLEGTAMIAQSIDGQRTRLVIPKQIAERALGCWVEVPLEGKLQLAAALKLDERYVARIHSHPGEAFHSSTDDANPALTHEGALSIVVPYFGLGLRRGLDATAIFVRQSRRWLELPPGADRREWIIEGQS